MGTIRLVQANLIVFDNFRFHPYFNSFFSNERENYIVNSYFSSGGIFTVLQAYERNKITRLIELFSQIVKKANEFKTKDSEIKLEFYTQDYFSSLHPPKYFHQFLRQSLRLLENSPHKDKIDVFFSLVQTRPKYDTNICTLLLSFDFQELFWC